MKMQAYQQAWVCIVFIIMSFLPHSLMGLEWCQYKITTKTANAPKAWVGKNAEVRLIMCSAPDVCPIDIPSLIVIGDRGPFPKDYFRRNWIDYFTFTSLDRSCINVCQIKIFLRSSSNSDRWHADWLDVQSFRNIGIIFQMTTRFPIHNHIFNYSPINRNQCGRSFYSFMYE